MKRLKKMALTLAAIAAALILAFWLGIQIKPAPFPKFSQQTPQLETVPLPCRCLTACRRRSSAITARSTANTSQSSTRP